MKKEEKAVNIEEFLDEYLDKSKVPPIEIEENTPMLYGPLPFMIKNTTNTNNPDNNLKNAKELLKDIITTKTKK